MSLFRRRSKGPHKHKWCDWAVHRPATKPFVWYRSCRCGAIQRFIPTTGEATIWTPDGVDSGLLDKGLTRQIFEELS